MPIHKTTAFSWKVETMILDSSAFFSPILASSLLSGLHRLALSHHRTQPRQECQDRLVTHLVSEKANPEGNKRAGADWLAFLLVPRARVKARVCVKVFGKAQNGRDK